jgi:hypothetical protein
MTHLDILLGGLVLAIFTGMLGLLLGGKDKVTTDDFEKHKTSPSPHNQCPVHETKLDTMKSHLDKMDEKLDRLLER